ncbi:hypothetical protein K457DRAFT_23922 [Linnemannia elongata AG-77]|uniref:Uncharacterized protein n=1 Tax=Linnemannia elongata AG-77 TaxID=1314771 RepID=A0A197JHF7_9FUNG|nr:hypothetical protein K457DRAFT_23922 [Linnemannia elongata AG-77]
MQDPRTCLPTKAILEKIGGGRLNDIVCAFRRNTSGAPGGVLRKMNISSEEKDLIIVIHICSEQPLSVLKLYFGHVLDPQSMVAVHIPAKKVFPYCYWWNSVTSKKYGYMWKNVGSKLVPLLLANYSFNDRPIHYIKVKTDDAGEVEIISEKVYERESGCTAMTLVAGKPKGMFPSLDTCEGLVYEFSEVGIVEHKNISIGWPEKKHSKKSRPLAVLVEKPTSDSHEGYIQWMKKPHPTLFTADYNILVPGTYTEYAVVAAGLADFRGNSYWHLVTHCGLKVKAGKTL